LRGGIEGCGRFIGDDQRWPARDRLSDQDSLPLPTAELMWIGPGNALGVRREDL